MSRSWRRTVAGTALLGAVMLFSTPAGAFENRSRQRVYPDGPAALARAAERTWILEVLEGFWHGLTAVWAPVGAGADPDGAPRPAGDGGDACAPGAACGSGDVGAGADPNG